jgi:hypothetical protein
LEDQIVKKLLINCYNVLARHFSVYLATKFFIRV